MITSEDRRLRAKALEEQELREKQAKELEEQRLEEWFKLNILDKINYTEIKQAYITGEKRIELRILIDGEYFKTRENIKSVSNKDFIIKNTIRENLLKHETFDVGFQLDRIERFFYYTPIFVIRIYFNY